MTTSFVMLLAMGVMFACGLYLMLDRSLTRVLLGFLLMGNATNILIMLTAGPPGRPPLTDGENLSAEGMNDPLPHALILTAIVITFSLSAFLLAMIYRSWRLVRNENLEDDIEDAKIALSKYRSTGEEAGTSGEYDDTEFGDEAQTPIPGALDLDEDGTPRERSRGVDGRAVAGGQRVPGTRRGGQDVRAGDEVDAHPGAEVPLSDGLGEAVPENPITHAEKENMSPEELDPNDEEGGR